jgi:hypothetical protein
MCSQMHVYSGSRHGEEEHKPTVAQARQRKSLFIHAMSSLVNE